MKTKTIKLTSMNALSYIDNSEFIKGFVKDQGLENRLENLFICYGGNHEFYYWHNTVNKEYYTDCGNETLTNKDINKLLTEVNYELSGEIEYFDTQRMSGLDYQPYRRWK